jgi:hypothetical protein
VIKGRSGANALAMLQDGTNPSDLMITNVMAPGTQTLRIDPKIPWWSSFGEQTSTDLVATGGSEPNILRVAQQLVKYGYQIPDIDKNK